MVALRTNVPFVTASCVPGFIRMVVPGFTVRVAPDEMVWFPETMMTPPELSHVVLPEIVATGLVTDVVVLTTVISFDCNTLPNSSSVSTSTSFTPEASDRLLVVCHLP